MLLRKDKGLPQEQLAEKAGVNASYMGTVERGDRNISLLYNRTPEENKLIFRVVQDILGVLDNGGKKQEKTTSPSSRDGAVFSRNISHI